MKVKQLIKKLQKLDPEAEIVGSDNFSEDTFDIIGVGENYIRVACQDASEEGDG